MSGVGDESSRSSAVLTGSLGEATVGEAVVSDGNAAETPNYW